MWEDLLQEPGRRDKELVEWVNDQGLLLLNEWNIPTYQSHDGQTMLTLDLTFMNAAAQQADSV